MRRSLAASVSAFAILASAGFGVDLSALPAAAAPVPYVNSPLDTPQALVNTVVTSLNNGYPAFQTKSTCSGNTTGTCTGLRFVESVTNLTTAPAGNVSALVTVTDTSIAAASDILCGVENYTGTGQPIVSNVTANAGNMTFQILNAAASGSLSATVPVFCTVYNP